MYNYIKDYPRPQLLRDQWENLNGTWDFAFDDTCTGMAQGWQNGFVPQHQIQVPFTFETKASGIEDPNPHSGVWYARTFTAVLKTLNGCCCTLKGATGTPVCL